MNERSDTGAKGVQTQLDENVEERTVMRTSQKRAQIITYILYGLTFLFLVFGVYLYSALQGDRQQRNGEVARADLIACARSNYQDVRDRLQDQSDLDRVTALSKGSQRQRWAVYRATKKQLRHRLRTSPPTVPVLLARWRGNPVSEHVLRLRAKDAAGPVARAEARDRGDLVKPPVNCDKLPSQRPFEP